MMTLTEKLNRVVDAYCAHVRRSRSRVSFIVFGDGSRLDGIAAGKDLNTRSWERAMAWFSANWPEGLAWPEGVERPEAATGGEQRQEAAVEPDDPSPRPSHSGVALMASSPPVAPLARPALRDGSESSRGEGRGDVGANHSPDAGNMVAEALP